MVHLKYSFNKINDQIWTQKKLKSAPSTNISLVVSKYHLEKAQCFQENLVCQSKNTGNRQIFP